MYYTLRQGAQGSWQDKIRNVIDELKSSNWLLAIVGAIIVVWFAMVALALMQSSPNVATPTAGANRGGDQRSLNVSTDPRTNQGITAGNSVTVASTTSDMTQPANKPASATTTSPQKATAASTNTSASTSNTIGGRGAEASSSTPSTSTPTTPTPSNPVQNPSTPAPATGGGLGVGVSLDTPLTPEPISVDLGVGGGSLLDLGVDLGL